MQGTTRQVTQNVGTSWQPPPQSVYKLNYDAAMFIDNASSGFGAVIRNFRGEVMAAMTAKGPAVQCSEEAELLACRKVMEFAIDAGFTVLIVEGDSVNAMRSIISVKENQSALGHVIGDIRHLMGALEWISVSCTKKNGYGGSTQRLERFSLLEEETNRVTLDEENPDAKEVILAAKFMTRRVLNIEAIGRTLKPLWKTRNGFEIRDVGNHILLFVFDNESEADRILAFEPWTYDKHLILLSRYDGSSPIRSIQFHTVKFWVQLHGLPVNGLNEKTAYEIGKSLGEVSRATQAGELIGDDFLRVRVVVNVTRPLNRGRKVLLGKDGEIWVTFRYEKMPNFCYWCGVVSHDAKECSVWLSSKGSLPLDQQGYGAWL
ncbi:hypothetical protein SO802_028652 [Lithocarpus litseifolius]|uniref:CCHC-type domain-containing protein n=1 Tax=Lithocarpus litseifolius TaxID=425828 RepID=A0AAW2BSR6_9ROSI